jgi:DNA-binding NtrC family response regulator
MTLARQRTTLLFVDDDLCSRDLAARTLVKAGFDVVAPADGVESMRCLRARPDIRGLISDIRMPKVNGVQLATMARDLDPEIKVALVTAHIEEAELIDQWPVWVKPLDIERLPSLAEQLCSCP